MINYLIGNVVEIDEKSITVLSNAGIGYEVFVNLNDLVKIQKSQNITLHIYSHIREDCFNLFGFINIKDKKFFEKLISVSGVGTKTALSILSITNTDNIIKAIESKNIELFPKVPGLGKKTMEKIILELNGKFANYISTDTQISNNLKDARLALEALGYNNKDIYNCTSEIQADLDMNTIIKNALKILSKNK
jgi:Holliday junction DNA helicase RuvA